MIEIPAIICQDRPATGHDDDQWLRWCRRSDHQSPPFRISWNLNDLPRPPTPPQPRPRWCMWHMQVKQYIGFMKGISPIIVQPVSREFDMESEMESLGVRCLCCRQRAEERLIMIGRCDVIIVVVCVCCVWLILFSSTRLRRVNFNHSCQSNSIMQFKWR